MDTPIPFRTFNFLTADVDSATRLADHVQPRDHRLRLRPHNEVALSKRDARLELHLPRIDISFLTQDLQIGTFQFRGRNRNGLIAALCAVLSRTTDRRWDR